MPELIIVGAILFHARADRGRIASLGRQGALDELLHAIADHFLEHVHARAWEAALIQHPIDGLGDVAQGVDEGAVEVEDEGLEGHEGMGMTSRAKRDSLPEAARRVSGAKQ